MLFEKFIFQTFPSPLIGNRFCADSRGNGIVVIIGEESLPHIAAGKGVSHRGVCHACPIDLKASHGVGETGMLNVGAVSMHNLTAAEIALTLTAAAVFASLLLGLKPLLALILRAIY